jgi:hypothetical protein
VLGVGVGVPPIDKLGVVDGVMDGVILIEGVLVNEGVLEGVIERVIVGVIDLDGVLEGVIEIEGLIEGVGVGKGKTYSLEHPKDTFSNIADDEGIPLGKSITYPTINSLLVTPASYKLNPKLPDK